MDEKQARSDRWISRRRFLKLLGAAGIGVAVPATGILGRKIFAGEHAPTGRITDGSAVTLPFDSSSGINDFDYTRHTENAGIVDDPVGSGKVLRIRFPQGSHYGVDFRYHFAENGFDEPEELYAQYRLYFPDDFQVDGQMGKLPGFGGLYTETGRGGKPVDGTDSWSARGEAREAGSSTVKIGYYTYHADMSGTYGDHFMWDRELQLGQWYTVKQYVKMNTPGDNDGVLRGWIDGDQVYERSDLLFREAGYDSIKIKSYLFNLYWGGSWTSPANNAIYFDNLQLSTSDITGDEADRVAANQVDPADSDESDPPC